MFTSDTAIVVEGVTKSFKNIRALDGIDLTVSRGKVLALLGPNGAGKTTLVRILTTLMVPDEGRALIMGYDLASFPNTIRSKIGLAGQYAAIDENLTGKENLEMVGRLYHLKNTEVKKRTEYLLERFGLAEAANRVTKTYSGGMRRRLDLGASLLGSPQILFLDEPTTGLDPQSRVALWDIIKELVQNGMTLLLTTQYLDEADRLSDTIAVMDHGKIIAKGTSKELKASVAKQVLEVEVADKKTLSIAAEVLSSLGAGKLHADFETNKITLPLSAGSTITIDAIRLLDTAKIEITNLAIHSPSLDDVFFALTGHTASS